MFQLFIFLFIFDKANWDNIKSDLEDTLKKIININNDAKSTVNEMWNLFKNNLTKSINKNIPDVSAVYISLYIFCPFSF
jgi:hypothetical protein